MPGQRIEKVIVVGFDGLMFEMVERFADEGRLPNMKRLIERGCWGRMRSCPPVDTPTNWTTLATGAPTATHGINTFAAWIPGRAPFDFPYFGSRANPGTFPGHISGDEQGDIHEYCAAEYVWQALERAGKRCLLFNYPGGWPPNIRDGVVVDGLGIGAGVPGSMGGPCLFGNDVSLGDGQAPLRWGEAGDWRDLPPSAIRPMASVMLLTGLRELAPDGGDNVPASDAEQTELYRDVTTRFHLLLTGETGDGYDTLWLCRGKSAASVVARLRSGEESEWIHCLLAYNAIFPVAFGLGRPKPMRREVRFKLLLRELRPDGRVELLRGATFPVSDWAFPDRLQLDLAEQLWRAERDAAAPGHITPVEGLTSQIDASLHSHLPDVAAARLDAFIRRSLLCLRHVASNEPWDVLFFQIHSPDGINHAYLNNLCSLSPGYDPSKERENWERFGLEYEMLDRCLGEVLSLSEPERTAVFLLSDHAALPTVRTVQLRKALLGAGLVVYRRRRLRKTSSMTFEEDEAGDEYLVLDLARSKVILGGHPIATSIWVNLKGREPVGAVSPGNEYEDVRTKVIELLYSLKDPKTGVCPVELALRKEEAAYLGQGGERAGDVLFYLRPGYVSGGLSGSIGPFPVTDLEQELFPDVKLGGCHHLYLPDARYGGFSVNAVLAMAGPGIRRGRRLAGPVNTSDAAPTLCHLLGVKPPKDARGEVIDEALIAVSDSEVSLVDDTITKGRLEDSEKR